MNREQAKLLSRGLNDGSEHIRPQSASPDSRGAREQLLQKEQDRFEMRLADAALAYDKRHSAWPAPGWFTKHKLKFRENMAKLYPVSQEDPPCKHWEKRMGDSSYLPSMRKLWEGRLREWVRQYPYLGSPSHPCGCYECAGGRPPVVDDWGFSEEMVTPYGME